MEKRIKAFTLMEVVLAMMLAAIVIGMAYTAFGLFVKMYGGYRQKNLGHADLQWMREALQRDMERAKVVRLEGDKIFMDSLAYQVGKDVLLRESSGRVDSFKLKELRVRGSFEGMPLYEGLADRLVLGFAQDSVWMELNAEKQYAADELVELSEGSWKR